jgi:hypothetical protein
MIPKEKVYVKKGERGIPYTLEEARKAVDTPDMDQYHKEIMSWLIYEVERLEKENKSLLNDLNSRLGAEEEKRLMELRQQMSDKNNLSNLEKLSTPESWEKASEKPEIKIELSNDCGGGFGFSEGFPNIDFEKDI